ncbi:MAG: hypothetical protein KGL39_27345 [Patescibacteria group bacterium]|nr:hypothetical protein [Patescibacteria group bacterium]
MAKTLGDLLIDLEEQEKDAERLRAELSAISARTADTSVAIRKVLIGLPVGTVAATVRKGYTLAGHGKTLMTCPIANAWDIRLPIVEEPEDEPEAVAERNYGFDDDSNGFDDDDVLATAMAESFTVT